MRIILSGYSAEGDAYLVRMTNYRHARKTELLLRRSKNKAIKSILAHGQLESVFRRGAIAHIDADMIMNSKRVSRTIMKKE